MQTAEDIAESLLEDVTGTEKLYGGDILAITRLLAELTDRQEERGQAGLHNFTASLMGVCGVVAEQEVGWREMGVTTSTRHTAVSALLTGLDRAGLLLLAAEHKHWSYTSPALSVHLTTVPPATPHCTNFSHGAVCAGTAVWKGAGGPAVASQLLPAWPGLLPSRPGPALLGLAVGRPVSLPGSGPGPAAPVRITFNQTDNMTAGEVECAAWGLAELAWQSQGCFLNPELSTESSVVCDCYHLTNFGIIMDWTGTVDPDNPFLSHFTTIGLSVSVVFLAATELVMWQHRGMLHASGRTRTAELQRNLWLGAGQLCFLLLVGRGEAGPLLCELAGATTHLAWSLFWAWSALEGYCLYMSLVRVFGRAAVGTRLAVATYLIPALVVTAVLVVSRARGLLLYLRPGPAGSAPVCWLSPGTTWVFLATVAAATAWNTAVTVRAVTAAYQSAKFRGVAATERVLAALRNTLVLTVMLGLTFTVGFIPSAVPGYFFVCLNTLSGLFIFFSTVVMNDSISLRSSISSLASSTASSGRASVSTLSSTASLAGPGGSLGREVRRVCRDQPHVMFGIQESSTRIIMKITVDKEADQLRSVNTRSRRRSVKKGESEILN